jgi:hypothetical protein
MLSHFIKPSLSVLDKMGFSFLSNENWKNFFEQCKNDAYFHRKGMF